MGSEFASVALESAWNELVRDLTSRLGAIRVAQGRKAIRRLRKTVRRLRFLIRSWPDALPKAERRRVKRGLRRLSDALSTARDAAVLEVEVSDVVARCDRQGLVRPGEGLVARLRARRVGATWQVVDEADRWFAVGLDELTHEMRFAPGGGLGVPAEEWVAPRLVESIAAVAAMGACLEREARPSERHDMRKAARLPLALGAVFGRATEPWAESLACLSDLRRRLGDLHDLEVTRQWLERSRVGEVEAADELPDYSTTSRAKLDACFAFVLDTIVTDHAERLRDVCAFWVETEPLLRG